MNATCIQTLIGKIGESFYIAKVKTEHFRFHFNLIK
jgi:hypothetical protein